METLEKIKKLMESIELDTKRVFENGNNNASIRARKNAQEVKNLIPAFRKEILSEIKRQKNG